MSWLLILSKLLLQNKHTQFWPFKTNTMQRRNFLTLVGTTLAAAPVWANVYNSRVISPKAGELAFPELPYPYDALEPYIDARTMELHYDKHHRGYFNNFKAAVKDTPLADQDIETIFSKVSVHSPAVRNNGGGYYNHKLFWENMGLAKTSPSAKLARAIDRDFGSFDKFKETFSGAARSHFGSGWVWLVAGAGGKLFVSSTPNQDNPLMDVAAQKGTPLLALDVWEHAYYLHYQNRRAEYVDNFWNIVNWDVVSKRFELV
jgi:Fe-Mn family superoxide dismutase